MSSWDPVTATYSVSQAQGLLYASTMYQGLLGRVAFDNPSSDPQTQNRTISIWAADDGGEGPKSNLTLVLKAVNQARPTPTCTFRLPLLSHARPASALQQAPLFRAQSGPRGYGGKCLRHAFYAFSERKVFL